MKSSDLSFPSGAFLFEEAVLFPLCLLDENDNPDDGSVVSVDFIDDSAVDFLEGIEDSKPSGSGGSGGRPCADNNNKHNHARVRCRQKQTTTIPAFALLIFRL